MRNSIKKLFSFVLALICLLTCAFAEGDEVVATYNGGEVTANEVERDLTSEINMMMTTMNYFAQMNGTGFYTASEEDLRSIREYVITAYAKYEILFNKMDELGVSDLTEEEKSNLRQNAEYYFLESVYSYTLQGLSADEAAYYLEMQGMNVDTLYENSYRNAIQIKLTNALSINEEVTDDEIQAKYEELCANYEKTYATAPASVESSANNGSPVYFMPENMKYVKHIILKPDDEALMAEYDDAVNQLLTYENEYATITAASYTPKYDDIVEKAIKEECIENMDLAKKALEEIQARVLENVKPTADKIYEALNSGESFDALVETYSKDPGAKQEPIKSKGYLVYENSNIWDGAFINTANALENVGDVSEPAVGYLGVYIVKYESAPEAGRIPLSEIKDQVVSTILSERKSDAFKAESEKWYEEANIQLNLDAYN